MKKLKWFYIIDTVIIILGIMLSVYFDSLEGYGFMPGFTYLSYIFISVLVALAGIVVMVTVSLILIIKKFRKK